MSSGLFNVALSGLYAAQAGLLTTGNNISNASTSGYSRQQIVQSTSGSVYSGSGFVGTGTTVSTIKRVYNQYLSTELLSAQTGAASAASYKSEIDQIDNLLGDSSAGLSSALTDFFNGVQTVAAHPSDTSARQSMLSTSQELVSRFQAIDQRLQELRDGVNTQIQSEVTKINSYASQIAELNQKIIVARAAGANQPPNDLLDQRDELVSQLNQEVKVTTTVQDDGSFNVFIGNGEPLVVGTLSYGMEAAQSPSDPQKLVVAIRSQSGALSYIPESQVTGGTLGGLVAFRSETLDTAQNAIGRIAYTLAQNFNDQHALGQDLNGNMGGTYFDISQCGPTVYANSNNVGSGAPSVTISAAGSLTTSDYQLSYDGTNYNLTRLSDNTTVATVVGSASSMTADGLTIDLSALSPSAGDNYTIEPTRAAAANLSLAISDPKAIAAASPIVTGAALTNTGSGAINSGTVNTVGGSLKDSVSIVFSSANSFDVYDTTTGTQLNASPVSYNASTGAAVSYNGWTVQLTGKPAAGDSFSVGANTNGVSDGSNAVALAALQTTKTMTGGTATYATAYAQLVSVVGNTANQVTVTGKAQQSLADEAQSARDEVSGVNLNEEAANLLRYQQAYQASAKIFDIAGKLFDQILQMGA